MMALNYNESPIVPRVARITGISRVWLWHYIAGAPGCVSDLSGNPHWLTPLQQIIAARVGQTINALESDARDDYASRKHQLEAL